MKGYRKFIIVIAALVVLYIVAEANRPKTIEWKVTLSRFDKGPYGAYILYSLLPALFPATEIISARQPMLDFVDAGEPENTAFVFIEPDIDLGKFERNTLIRYVKAGNYVFMSAASVGKLLGDTLNLDYARRFGRFGDSATVNFVNPLLAVKAGFAYRPLTLNAYFRKVDTAAATVLGNNQQNDVNFISVKLGEGTIFVHANPLCFSNDFLLTAENSKYAEKALSYLPKNVTTIYWDEYHKLGRDGSTSPMRFILGNVWLKWSFRLGILAMLCVLFFESKRRQRIIPIVSPLRNTTLDFVRTVGSAYFNRGDHQNLALKKITYFTEFVRSRFYLSTHPMDETFIIAFAAKTGRAEDDIRKLVGLIGYVTDSPSIDQETLLSLTGQIDSFYVEFGTESLN
jgi:hypothetical protein